MSEIPSAQPDSDEIRWNTGPSDEPKTEPNASKKNVGYTLNEVPPRVQWNWLLNKIYLLIVHLLGRTPREFETLSEAEAAASDLDTVRVRPIDSIGFPNRELDDVFPADKTAGGAPESMCTDCKAIYYTHGTLALRAMDPETGTELWADTTRTAITTVVTCDGYRVYVGRVFDVTDPEVEAFDPVTGLTKGTANFTGDVDDLAANGEKLSAARDNDIEIFTVLASSLSSVGVAPHGAPVNATAIDDTYGYLGGNQSGGIDLRAARLTTAAIIWSVQFPTTGAAVVRAMIADGNFVYVGTDRIVLTAGGNANIFVYSRLGVASWTADLGAGINVTRVRVDDVYLYAYDGSNDDTYVLDKRTGVVLFQLGTATDRMFDVDGISAIVTDGTTNWNRRLTRGGTRSFMKGIARDPSRRPYHKLLLPLERGDL